MGALTDIDHEAGSSCPRCGKALPPRTSFCRRCGLSLHPGSRLPAGWILAIGAAGLAVSCLVAVGLYQSPGDGELHRAALVLPETPVGGAAGSTDGGAARGDSGGGSGNQVTRAGTRRDSSAARGATA